MSCGVVMITHQALTASCPSPSDRPCRAPESGSTSPSKGRKTAANSIWATGPEIPGKGSRARGAGLGGQVLLHGRHLQVALWCGRHPPHNVPDRPAGAVEAAAPPHARDLRRCPHSRLYGWLMHAYQSGGAAMRRDLPHRAEHDLATLPGRLWWLTWEDCNDVLPGACPQAGPLHKRELYAYVQHRTI